MLCEGPLSDWLGVMVWIGHSATDEAEEDVVRVGLLEAWRDGLMDGCCGWSFEFGWHVRC